MIMNYKKVKADVLKQYDAFLPLVMEFKGDRDTTFDATLEKLQNDAENVKNDIFRLMIVGEAKSGKSTFINAYLGKEILPMDVRECTSAIIEIRYGAKYTLKVTYADNNTKTFDKEEAIEKFLKENAALDDKYRDIPVGIINLRLIVPSQGEKILEAEIKALLKSIEKENIQQLDKPVYEEKVRQYIAEKLSRWTEVVKKIEIKYPFEDEDLKGIQIVDSPGVNTDGRLGEITNEYIVNANAVMFLKPITGAALRATSFSQFLDTVSADRNKDAIFLVLTRAANENADNVACIHDEACKSFPDINPKQIIHLDSKVELFRKKIKGMTEEELGVFIDKQIETKKLDAFLEAPWYRARCNRDVYLEKLSALSNFNEMDMALNQFARKAQYILLSQMLGRMILVLEKIEAELEEDIKNYKTKAQDPMDLNCKLLNAEEVLKGLKYKINTVTSRIASRYNNTDGIIDARVEAEMAFYKKEIDNINSDTPNSVEELEKITLRKLVLLAKFEEEIQKNIVAECDEALITFSKKDDLNYTSLKPDLTPDVINKIKAEHLDQAKETYTTGICFKETRTKINQSRFFKYVRDDLQRRLEEIWEDLTTALRDYVTQVTSAYRSELTRNATLQEERYKQIREDIDNAEEIQKKIMDFETKLKQVQPMMSEISSLKGGIDKNA